VDGALLGQVTAAQREEQEELIASALVKIFKERPQKTRADALSASYRSLFPSKQSDITLHEWRGVALLDLISPVYAAARV
jgi:hypothetical protein